LFGDGDERKAFADAFDLVIVLVGVGFGFGN
jgi:hypothetical protein